MHYSDEESRTFNFEVHICGNKIKIEAPNEMEAATLAIEHNRMLKINFDIGPIIQVINQETQIVGYVLSEIALANAGLYKEARLLQEAVKSNKKKP